MSSDDWEWWQDVPEEREEEIIEKISQYVVNHKLGDLMHLILQMSSPFGRLGSEMSLAVLGTYMDYLGAAEFLAVFRREGNIERLLNRIEETLEKKQISEKEPAKN